MLEVEAGNNQKLRIFISYSRRDLDFADQLATVLEWQGFQVIIDRKGIHGAENWAARLGQLILASDTVVFVLSPDSAASEICKWEVEEAARRAKRIVPVLCRSLAGAKPHEILQDLNYIHFYSEKDIPGSGFGTGQVKLIDVLKIDIDWLREHTRLEELAARWEKSDRTADCLLRGSELANYMAWRDRRPTNAPDLSVLQRIYLEASEELATLTANTERERAQYDHLLIEEIKDRLGPLIKARELEAIRVRNEGWGSGNWSRGGLDDQAQLGIELASLRYLSSERFRWHPLRPEYLRDENHGENVLAVYRFPCCGRELFADTVPPSRFTNRGCQPLPGLQGSPDPTDSEHELMTDDRWKP